MPTQAVYYRAADGFEPVAEFLDDEFPLEPRKKNPSTRELEAAATKRMTVDLQIDRLKRAGQMTTLRCPSRTPRRSMARYASFAVTTAERTTGSSADGRGTCVLLHMIRKTSKAVPRSEIEIAKQRWQDFKDRMEARPRKPPRAAGQDAP
jgi:hypothetical protein